VVAVAEAWRDDVRTRGKIHCHPQIAFVRENLVRRVVRPSSQFSAPTFGCKRRAPTNEGCRPWCPVHLDAWPGSREFPALELEVVGRRAHIWGESSTLASHVPHISPALGTGRISCRQWSPFSVLPRKTHGQDDFARGRNGFAYCCRKRMEDNFIRPSQQIFAADSC